MKYKIAIFSENSSYGGISSYCFDICKILHSKGFDVSLVIPIDKRITNRTLVELTDKEKIPYYEFPICDNLLKMSKILMSFIDENSFNVVHTNGYRLNTLIRLGRFFFSRKKILFHIVSVHSALPFKYSTIKQYLYAIINNLGNRFNHKTIAVSNYTKEYILCNSWGAKLDVELIYNGISSTTKCRKNKINCKSPIVVSYLGRLSPEKGIHFLKNIIIQYLLQYPEPEIQFEICGDGNCVNEIKLLQNMFPKQVIYRGFVKDTDSLLDKTDILLLTSKIETFGLVLIEATFHNAAVIATKVGGIPEIIRSNYNGVLIEYGNVDLCVKALRDLAINENKRKTYIENFKKIIEEKFLLENNINSYVKLLNSLKNL